MSRHPLIQKISRALAVRCGVCPGDRVLLAISGGADSVAMLRAMHTLAAQRRWRLQLVVGHVHHHLRDPEADDDAAFVQALAKQCDLPFLQQDVYPGHERGNIESHARRLRYTALAQMAQTSEASAIATAHHGDDQMETLLMRALRGTSVKGLCGIAWQRPLSHGLRVIRPMLLADRLMARDYLAQWHQPYREDHTNQDMSRTRAKLRHAVLPTLHAMAKGSTSRRASAISDHMNDLHQLLDQQVDLVWSAMEQNQLPREVARTINRAVLTGVLRKMAMAEGAAPDRIGRRVLEQLAKAAVDTLGGERTFALSGHVTASVTREHVWMVVDQSC